MDRRLIDYSPRHGRLLLRERKMRNEMERLTVRIPVDEKQALRDAAEWQGESMSLVFRLVLRRYLHEVGSIRGIDVQVSKSGRFISPW